MNEDRGAGFLRRAPDRVERAVVEIAAILLVAEFVRVDVRADLDAAQAKLAHATDQLARRELRSLQRDRAQPGETRRMLPNDFGQVIV